MPHAGAFCQCSLVASLLMGCCALQGQYKQAVACSYETVLLGARTGREDIIANQTVEVRRLDGSGTYGGITTQPKHTQGPRLVQPGIAQQAERKVPWVGRVDDAPNCSTAVCLCYG